MISAETKLCYKCNTERSVSEFSKNSRAKDGYAYRCLPCGRQYYAENRQTYIDKAKLWKASNLDRLRLSNRKTQVKSVYGLDWETFLNLYNSAEGRCEICKTFVELAASKDNTSIAACVDHCHITGKVRGILCKHCNSAIGFLRDSKDNAKAAFKYLEKHDNLR